MNNISCSIRRLSPAKKLSHFFILALCLRQPAAAQQPLVIDHARSRFDITVKATVGTFVGTLTNYAAEIAVDPEKQSIEQVIFEFHVDDVQTGNGRRNKDMLDWEQAAMFPEGRFTLKSLEAAAGSQFQARGTLILHGQSREITFPVVISHDHDHYSIDGEASLDTRDFGLPILRSYWLLTVEPIVRVRFHLQGNLNGLSPPRTEAPKHS